MSAEAGREFDKLATALTTPRHSLTREVNLVVSLSRTPPVNYVSQPEPSVTQLRQVCAIQLSVHERGAEAFNQLRFTHRATSFPVAAALSDNRVPASVQNPRSYFNQRSDCSISSSCLSISVFDCQTPQLACDGCAPLLKQRAPLVAALLVCVRRHGGHSPWSDCEVADTRQCAAGALTLASPRRD